MQKRIKISTSKTLALMLQFNQAEAQTIANIHSFPTQDSYPYKSVASSSATLNGSL
jgi:hypothetical protein